MGSNDIVYIDPVGATVRTKSDEIRTILYLVESEPVEPPRCLSCKKPAEVYLGLNIQDYQSVIWDIPFCVVCKERLEENLSWTPIGDEGIPEGVRLEPEAITEEQAAAGLEKAYKEREDIIEKLTVDYPQGRWEPSDEKCARCDTLMEYKGGHMPRYHCPQCHHELEV